MNRKVRIEVKTNYDLVSFLIDKNIFYNEFYHEKDIYKLNINYKDYKSIKIRFNSRIIRYYGVSFINNFILVNRYFIISLFICFLLLYNLCNTIYEININCEDENVLNKLNDFLVLNNFSLKRKVFKYEKINDLKDKILKNINEIEWIEFERVGTSYNIDVSLKFFGNKNIIGDKSNIIASRDGVIRHIVVHNGEKLREENEFVKKGDIIVSGRIYNGCKLVDEVESSAQVFAETWYLVKINVPLIYNESTVKDSFNHYYIDFFGKKISLIGQYNPINSVRENMCILDKGYLPFKVYKEKVFILENVSNNISYEEAVDYGIKMGVSEIEKMLDDGEYIISKNVLKKGLKSSKMYIEVFFKVYEDIGVTSNIFEEENINEECDS